MTTAPSQIAPEWLDPLLDRHRWLLDAEARRQARDGRAREVLERLSRRLRVAAVAVAVLVAVVLLGLLREPDMERLMVALLVAVLPWHERAAVRSSLRVLEALEPRQPRARASSV